MAGDVAPAQPPVGICLSGGGFRAALYGLGVLRYLAEAEVLPRAAVVCGVSGGSVAAAALGSGVKMRGTQALSGAGFREHVMTPFVTAVTDNDIRGQALRRWLAERALLRGRPRNLVLGEVLGERLFPAVDRLADLPERPQHL
jgi:NTE family protein